MSSPTPKVERRATTTIAEDPDVAAAVAKLVHLFGLRQFAMLIVTLVGGVQVALLGIIVWLAFMQRTLRLPTQAIQWVSSIDMVIVVLAIPAMIGYYRWKTRRL